MKSKTHSARSATHELNSLADVRPRHQQGVLTVDVADEKLLYAASQETATSLNRSARVIWELCDGERTVREIADEIGRQLDCDNAHAFSQLRADVEATVAELKHNGLLAFDD